MTGSWVNTEWRIGEFQTVLSFEKKFFLDIFASLCSNFQGILSDYNACTTLCLV